MGFIFTLSRSWSHNFLRLQFVICETNVGVTMTAHKPHSLVFAEERTHGCSWFRSYQTKPLKYHPRRQFGIEILQSRARTESVAETRNPWNRCRAFISPQSWDQRHLCYQSWTHCIVYRSHIIKNGEVPLCNRSWLLWGHVWAALTCSRYFKRKVWE